MARIHTQWRSFEDARAYVHSLKLKGSIEWQKYCISGQKPENIPSAPREIYKEYTTIKDWLGNRRSFEDAKAYVHSLHLKNAKEWQKYCTSGQKPYDIPSRPHMVYKNEWKGWEDWIGTGDKNKRRRYYSNIEGKFVDY